MVKDSSSKRLRQNIVFLGIGTNKGNRKKYILKALSLLSKNTRIKILKISRMLKNPPQEGIKTGFFLNGVIKIKTSLSPKALLLLCKKIEKKLGRQRKTEKTYHSISQQTKTSRTIDLDILLYESKIIKTKNLTIPHPKLHKRYFVLLPLLDCGKNIIHPKLKKTMEELNEKIKKAYSKISMKFITE